ncbi:hypothetical protein Acy02nite_91790 [Actinoplanes cyaneus]|uniref:Uncharacterized protein n=1 Tax=Actinoplanes cyaneus TaxID=52696 RepID=A0A919ITV7_9ACTN|nr:hypothetical protein [Actinoplanes cyaneus]MCW2144570.1 hypothetical protein [Actinoplanes cyaneus]GID71298.1 hypothetical protein Acy02nite_91790 [Actinoplanes cyaneus]
MTKRWLHRFAVALATLFVLVGAVGAPVTAVVRADPLRYDWLVPVPFGDPLYEPILLYRDAHEFALNQVPWGRNVAVFSFMENGVLKYIVVGSVPKGATPNTYTWIDIFRYDNRTRQWKVESSKRYAANRPPGFGNLTSLDGLHAEWLAYLYLNDKDLADTVDEGLSERIPCEDAPNVCRSHLDPDMSFSEEQIGRWFPNLYDQSQPAAFRTPMKYLDPGGARSDSELKTRLAGLYHTWVKHDRNYAKAARAMEAARVGRAKSGTANGALTQALSGTTDLGGIDFSTLELRYVAAPGTGTRFAFDAAPAKTPPTAADRDRQLDEGRRAALLASDAFWVWLSLPTDTNWVNLNPNQPDQIIEKRLGTTEAGKIMLEADLRMKKTVAADVHPDKPAGKKYWAAWDALHQRYGDQPCLTVRLWIVPQPASVREDNGGLYILDAPLTVNVERVFLESGTPAVNGAACPAKNDAAGTFVEGIYRSHVLPSLIKAVNTAPEYADLRRIYLARVAAEWYRATSDTGPAADLIDSGDVSAWPLSEQWRPRTTFDDYVRSFHNGEYNFQREVRKGQTIWTYTYRYGGVDFGTVELAAVDEQTFQQQRPGAADAVAQSFTSAAADRSGRTWLGVSAAEEPSEPAAPTATTASAASATPPAVAAPPAARHEGWHIPDLPKEVWWMITGGLLVILYRIRRAIRRRRVPTGE